MAYSIGDEIRQFILSPPFVWRWNRGQVAPIVCKPGTTDYTVNIPDFGWVERAWILYPYSITGNILQIYNSMNILSISIASGVVTVLVDGNPIDFGFYIGQTISIQQVVDSTFDAFQTLVISGLGPNTITYSQIGPTGSSTGGIVFNISTIATPTVTSTGPLSTKELTINQTLAQESVLGQPGYISVIGDDNNGNITFRLMPSPDQPYTLSIIYQKASPTFESTIDTWNPIPDYLSYLYTKGFEAKAYEYKGDERFAFAWQEFLKMVLSASDGLTETQKNIYLDPQIVTAREKGAVQTSQQARAARGGA